jgi:uncharacterized protein (DUF302 family)
MSGHKDRVQALAHTTLDLGHKLDGVIGTQARHTEAIARLEAGQTEHGAAIAKVIDAMNANHLDLNAKLNLILSKLG